MARECKQICETMSIYSKSSNYEGSSYCRECDMWLNIPTHFKLEALFPILPNINDPDCQYYGIDGIRKNVIVYYPIAELVRKKICFCCGSICRGGKRNAKDESHLMEPEYQTNKDSGFPRKESEHLKEFWRRKARIEYLKRKGWKKGEIITDSDFKLFPDESWIIVKGKQMIQDRETGEIYEE
jgi:hypothetical protein